MMQSTKVIVIFSICLSVVYSKSLHKKSDEDCPEFCPELYEPVCASDGHENKIFANTCLLKAHNCREAKKDYEVLSFSQCKSEPLLETILPELKNNCTPCPYIYLPVCGVDEQGEFRTFASECDIGFVNCEESRNYQVLRSGLC